MHEPAIGLPRASAARGSRSRDTSSRLASTCSCSPGRRDRRPCTRSSTRSSRPSPAPGRRITCCEGRCRSPSSRSCRRRLPTPARGGAPRSRQRLGALALEGAALAIADARAVGARGEDWTGFLLLPVGLVLLALAVVLLWRSRKPGRFRYLRRGGIVIATVVAAYWLVSPLAIGILATHRPRGGRPRRPRTAVRGGDGPDERRPRPRRLVRPLAKRRRRASPTRPGRGKLPQARMLVRHGYGVLLLDARGYDGSEGDPNLLGWEGAKDIDAAVAWLAAAGPMSRRSGSAASASRSAAR